MNDLRKKSRVELVESINRQKSLLLKKDFIAKLPDQGSKIHNALQQLERELSDRQEAVPNIPHLSALERLEWTGEYACEDDRVDSDDDSADETDPLRILATQSGAGMYKKKYRIRKPELSLIQPEDLVVDPVEAYASRLCHRDETAEKVTRQAYKPYRTVVPHEPHAPRPKNAHWEVTAATPPPYQHGDTKSVGLAESLTLQADHKLRLKEMQAAQAADRLASQIERMYLAERPESEASTSTADSVGQIQEALEEQEEEEEERGGIVVYSLEDDQIS